MCSPINTAANFTQENNNNNNGIVLCKASSRFHKLAQVCGLLLILHPLALQKHDNNNNKNNNGIALCMASSWSSIDLQIPETELSSLISFSKGIIRDPLMVFQAWTRDNASRACSWPGVQCSITQSNQSINVVSLNLTNFRLEGTISPSLGQLAFLNYLDLSSNFLYGTIPLSIATNGTALQYIDLSHNQISGSIPDYNIYLPSLKILNLANNQLTGPMPSFINSTSIIAIDFTYNNITGTFPLQYNCPSLQQLLLAKNSLTGFLPPHIVNITSLQYLNVLGNSLTGTIPVGFSYLTVVGLAENNFHGVIPVDLFNSSTLQMIDVAANNLTGEIPSVRVNQVKESPLFILSLSENGLSGEVPESIYNFTNLQDLEIARNKLSGRISNRLGDLQQLSILRFGFNSFHGSIPESIGNLSLLTRVNFQVSNLEGKIPESIGRLTELQGLYLDHNNLHGGIPLSLSNCTKLVQLELSRNIQLGGTLHPDFFNKLTRLSTLDLAFCKLTGQIPEDLTQSGSLIKYLSLAGNALSGHIASALFQGPAAMHLMVLDLSRNLLEGPIPITIGKLTSLRYLDLSRNSLVGEIPSEFSDCLSLSTLNLSQNSIAGLIPQSLTELQNLKLVNLSWNQLEGAVPLNFSASTELSLEGNRALCFPNTTGYKLRNMSGVADVCVTTVISTDQKRPNHNIALRPNVILTLIFCFILLLIFLALIKDGYISWKMQKKIEQGGYELRQLSEGEIQASNHGSLKSDGSSNHRNF